MLFLNNFEIFFETDTERRTTLLFVVFRLSHPSEYNHSVKHQRSLGRNHLVETRIGLEPSLGPYGPEPALELLSNRTPKEGGVPPTGCHTVRENNLPILYSCYGTST